MKPFMPWDEFKISATGSGVVRRLALAAVLCSASILVQAQTQTQIQTQSQTQDTATSPGSTKEWPQRPVTLIVPAAAGGTTDMAARILADKMGPLLGQTVVVENRAGAAGIVGTQSLLNAPADGYTLMMGNIGPNAINYSLYPQLPYKPQDFSPITLVVSVPNVVVVNSQLPVTDVAQLQAYLRNPAQSYSFGSPGIGQSPHLSAELFLQQAQLTATHIPFKGAAPAVAALLASQITFMIDNLPSSLPHIKAGKLRALAVTGQERSKELPDIPTLKELGMDHMVVYAWFGLVAHAQTPKPILEKIHKAAAQALRMPEVQEKLQHIGGTPGGNTPQEFAAFIQQERARWQATVQKAQIKME